MRLIWPTFSIARLPWRMSSWLAQGVVDRPPLLADIQSAADLAGDTLHSAPYPIQKPHQNRAPRFEPYVCKEHHRSESCVREELRLGVWRKVRPRSGPG
jgi:hypothetical protein